MTELRSIRPLAQVAALRPYEPGKPVETLERELGVTNAIKLASNENPWGPSPQASAAIGAIGPAALARYPDGATTQLRVRVAEFCGVDPAMVTPGNGSNDVLELVARTFAGPGDTVAYAEHAFTVYAIVAQAVGATHAVVPARHYGHDFAALATAAARSRIVYVANPNNPTGTCVDGDTLLAFLRAVPRDVVVVLDEAYREYVDAGFVPETAPWLAEFPNLVLTRTFSKVYGLAGLRLGYALSSPVIADLLARVRQPFNVNQLAQVAGLAALDDQDFVRRSVEHNRAGRAMLADGLTAQGCAVTPSQGNFLMFEVGDAVATYQALLHEGVIVRPIGAYGLPRHLRVTVGTPDENTRFLAALARVRQRIA